MFKLFFTGGKSAFPCLKFPQSALPAKGEVRFQSVIRVASPWRIQKDSLYRRILGQRKNKSLEGINTSVLRANIDYSFRIMYSIVEVIKWSSA